jgi:hypothetical protein
LKCHFMFTPTAYPANRRAGLSRWQRKHGLPTKGRLRASLEMLRHAHAANGGKPLR